MPLCWSKTVLWLARIVLVCVGVKQGRKESSHLPQRRSIFRQWWLSGDHVASRDTGRKRRRVPDLYIQLCRMEPPRTHFQHANYDCTKGCSVVSTGLAMKDGEVVCGGVGESTEAVLAVSVFMHLSFPIFS